MFMYPLFPDIIYWQLQMAIGLHGMVGLEG